MTWLERMAQDPSLRDFVQAEIVRAGIELDTLRYNLKHSEEVNVALEVKLKQALDLAKVKAKK